MCPYKPLPRLEAEPPAGSAPPATFQGTEDYGALAALDTIKPLPRLELGTSALPRQRSNQLSYRGMIIKNYFARIKDFLLANAKESPISLRHPLRIYNKPSYLKCMRKKSINPIIKQFRENNKLLSIYQVQVFIAYNKQCPQEQEF